VCKADKASAICEPFVYKMWEPRRLTALSASRVCYKGSFTFIIIIIVIIIIIISIDLNVELCLALIIYISHGSFNC
jgi:hypothetical protein